MGRQIKAPCDPGVEYIQVLRARTKSERGSFLFRNCFCGPWVTNRLGITVVHSRLVTWEA